MKFSPLAPLGALFLLLSLGGCAPPVIVTPTSTGSLTGKVLFGSSPTGVLVSVEKSDGLRTVTVQRSLTAGTPRAALVSTTPNSDGNYQIDGLESGLYTVYASSNDSKEKAVTTNVEVTAGRSIAASDLQLTPVGGLNGLVQIGGAAQGNAGFIVFIAGTSYLAITGDSGAFALSDVPVGSDYAVLVMKGDHVFNYVVTSVFAATTSDIGKKVITAADLVNPAASISWRGSFAVAPTSPVTNWAYYDTTAKKSYIWDSSAWQILAQDGTTGSAGATDPVILYTQGTLKVENLNLPDGNVVFEMGIYWSSGGITPSAQGSLVNGSGIFSFNSGGFPSTGMSGTLKLWINQNSDIDNWVLDAGDLVSNSQTFTYDGTNPVDLTGLPFTTWEILQ